MVGKFVRNQEKYVRITVLGSNRKRAVKHGSLLGISGREELQTGHSAQNGADLTE